MAAMNKIFIICIVLPMLLAAFGVLDAEAANGALVKRADPLAALRGAAGLIGKLLPVLRVLAGALGPIAKLVG